MEKFNTLVKDKERINTVACIYKCKERITVTKILNIKELLGSVNSESIMSNLLFLSFLGDPNIHNFQDLCIHVETGSQ